MKKLSVTRQILNILNTQGGKKPKQLIAITKAKPASIYTALNQLRGRKLIAKEDDVKYLPSLLTTGESNYEDESNSSK
jgi:hypothetical protein